MSTIVKSRNLSTMQLGSLFRELEEYALELKRMRKNEETWTFLSNIF